MSIRVAPGDLERVVDAFEWGYLVTIGREHPHVESQAVQSRDGALHLVGVGQTSIANIVRKARVTLVFPPGAAGAADDLVPVGFTLLVDGLAEIAERAKRTAIVVRPSSAVFHRPAPAQD